MASDPVTEHLQALWDSGATSVTIDGKTVAVDRASLGDALRARQARDLHELAQQRALPSIFAELQMPFE